MTTIEDEAFHTCFKLVNISIPNTVTSIKSGTFVRCNALKDVVIPDSVLNIELHAFSNCRGLTSLTIPNSVMRIGQQSFEGCIGLTNLVIPASVTSIGRSAFSGCSGLTSVTIGNGVTSIGERAFSGCSGLMSISVGAGNANYKSVNGLLLSKDGTRLIQGVNGDVTIGNGVTSIGERAFSGCSGLTSVTIPNGVTSLGSYVFYGCSGLTSVTIPASVTSIERSAFSGCSGLTSLAFNGDAPSVKSYAFNNVGSGCTAYVMRTASGFPEEGSNWNGLTIAYLSDDPLPIVASDAEVSAALSGAADETRLEANLTTTNEYNAFREWAGDNAAAVKASAFAWTAFALDAPALIARTEPITSDDIEIASISPVMADGSFALEVGLKDVEIGDGVAPERLVKVFGLEGAVSLSPALFSSENVTLKSCSVANGKVRFTAAPSASAQGDGRSFFIRARMNQ